MRAEDITQQIRYAMRINDEQDDGGYMAAIEVLNQAGERVVTAKRWRFLGGSVAEVVFDDEGYAQLPDDFSEITSVSISGGVQLVTPARVTAITPGAGPVAVAVTHKATADGYKPFLVASTKSQPTARVCYRRGWGRITKDEDLIQMPDWMKHVLTEMCRAYAAMIEGDTTTRDGLTRADQVVSGPAFKEAAVRDGLTQADNGTYGVGSGGSGDGSPYLPVGSDWLNP